MGCTFVNATSLLVQRSPAPYKVAIPSNGRYRSTCKIRYRMDNHLHKSLAFRNLISRLTRLVETTPSNGICLFVGKIMSLGTGMRNCSRRFGGYLRLFGGHGGEMYLVQFRPETLPDKLQMMRLRSGEGKYVVMKVAHYQQGSYKCTYSIQNGKRHSNYQRIGKSI